MPSRELIIAQPQSCAARCGTGVPVLWGYLDQDREDSARKNHQHFNAGAEPARYLAATWGGEGKWFMRTLGGGARTHRLGKTSIRKGGNLIEYEDEDPAIREMYSAELQRAGIPVKMP